MRGTKRVTCCTEGAMRGRISLMLSSKLLTLLFLPLILCKSRIRRLPATEADFTVVAENNKHRYITCVPCLFSFLDLRNRKLCLIKDLANPQRYIILSVGPNGSVEIVRISGGESPLCVAAIAGILTKKLGCNQVLVDKLFGQILEYNLTREEVQGFVDHFYDVTTADYAIRWTDEGIILRSGSIFLKSCDSTKADFMLFKEKELKDCRFNPSLNLGNKFAGKRIRVVPHNKYQDHAFLQISPRNRISKVELRFHHAPIAVVHRFGTIIGLLSRLLKYRDITGMMLMFERQMPDVAAFEAFREHVLQMRSCCKHKVPSKMSNAGVNRPERYQVCSWAGKSW